MSYGPTSAPLVFEDLVVVGFSNDEGHPGAPGDIRAFDVRTGQERWRFHTVPRPGEEGHDTWPQMPGRSVAAPMPGEDSAWMQPAASCSAARVPPARTSTAQTAPGPDCLPIARWPWMRARATISGISKRSITTFGTTTIPARRSSSRFSTSGRAIDAVAQVTKTGYCYLLDLKTGKPLFPVREQPAPSSDIPGEIAFATQPQPDKPPRVCPAGVYRRRRDHALAAGPRLCPSRS